MPDDADRLLGHHNFEREPAAGPPPGVQRTPTRKERIPRLPGGAPAVTPGPPPAAPVPQVTEKLPAAASPEDDATPFRPSRRPPVAFLCVLDDGDDEGEWVRLRTDSVVIGRGQGEIVIPHDGLMSGRHAEISRVNENGRYRWVLTDLGSTNGTFVRVERATLKPGKELQVGRTRMGFDSAAPPPSAPATDAPIDPRATVGWQSVSPAALLPALVVITPKGDGPRHPLAKSEIMIGRGEDCDIPLPDDPFAARRHAKLTRDPEGVWHVAADATAHNGLWLRLTGSLTVSRNCTFMLGEQQFLLKAP